MKIKYSKYMSMWKLYSMCVCWGGGGLPPIAHKKLLLNHVLAFHRKELTHQMCLVATRCNLLSLHLFKVSNANSMVKSAHIRKLRVQEAPNILHLQLTWDSSGKNPSRPMNCRKNYVDASTRKMKMHRTALQTWKQTFNSKRCDSENNIRSPKQTSLLNTN